MIDETSMPLPDEKQDERVPWKPANAVQRCERSGGHIVKAPSWPPTQSPSRDEPPSFSLQCTRCDGWLVIYEDTKGVKILKPELKSVR